MGTPRKRHQPYSVEEQAIARDRWIAGLEPFPQKKKRPLKNRKAVERQRPDGTWEKFSSMREAELRTGVSYSSISKCCRGQTHTAGGIVWRRWHEES